MHCIWACILFSSICRAPSRRYPPPYCNCLFIICLLSSSHTRRILKSSRYFVCGASIDSISVRWCRVDRDRHVHRVRDHNIITTRRASTSSGIACPQSQKSSPVDFIVDQRGGGAAHRGLVYNMMFDLFMGQNLLRLVWWMRGKQKPKRCSKSATKFSGALSEKENIKIDNSHPPRPQPAYSQSQQENNVKVETVTTEENAV